MTTQSDLAQALRDAIVSAENIAVCNKRECSYCRKDAEFIVANLKVLAAHDRQREAGEVDTRCDDCHEPTGPQAVCRTCSWLRGESLAGTRKVDRDAERKRFPDVGFNAWLDDAITDCGHTVRDMIRADLADAWAAWEARDYYGGPYRTTHAIDPFAASEARNASGVQTAVTSEAVDAGCICKGNWRAIVAETEHLIGRDFTDDKGTDYVLFGIVHGGDDYYYGMMKRRGEGRKLALLSCVGSIEGHGYTPKLAAALGPQPVEGVER